MTKPFKTVYIDKNRCSECERNKSCVCHIENKDTCSMICIGCGACLCHPERKDCCIDGHYVYQGDFIMCVECYETKRKGIYATR